MMWIVGKTGILAQAFSRKCKEKNLKFISTSKEEVDITQFLQIESFLKTHQIDFIINCSGYTNVEKAEEEKEKAFLLNAEGVKNLAICAEKAQVKLVHFSTDYVFDGSNSYPYKEEELPHPLNIYGQSKLEGEKILFQFHSKPLLIRISWLFGTAGKSFVSVMQNLMQAKEEIFVVEDQIGRASFADDVVEAALHLQNEQGIFHFANQEVISWYEFALEIYECLKERNKNIFCNKITPILSKDFAQKALRPKYSALDTHKIQKTLSFTIPSYKEALKRYFAFQNEEKLLCQKN